jgi:hypothetical protein
MNLSPRWSSVLASEANRLVFIPLALRGRARRQATHCAVLGLLKAYLVPRGEAEVIARVLGARDPALDRKRAAVHKGGVSSIQFSTLSAFTF